MSLAHGDQIRVMEEHGEVGRGINWWGMIFFIISEALIFANFIAAYLYLEIRNGSTGQWSMPEGHEISWVFPAINTIFLLGSSIPAVYARKSIVAGNKRGLIVGLAGTILLGVIFLGGQVYEYITLFSEGFFISTNIFGSAFYTLTGFHGLHVSVGVLFLVVCLVRAIRGDFTAKKHFAVEAGEMYWHFVDIVWIVVFLVVYIVPLFQR